jgi:hypothetical protein
MHVPKLLKLYDTNETYIYVRCTRGVIGEIDEPVKILKKILRA